jgi:porin
MHRGFLSTGGPPGRLRGFPRLRWLSSDASRLVFILALVAALTAAPARADRPDQDTASDSRADASPLSTAPNDPETKEPQDIWHRDAATGEWGGLRDRMERRGVSIDIDWLMEGFKDFRGGITTGSAGASTFDVSLTLDMQKSFGLSGGRLHLGVEDHAGRNPSAVLVGDVQLFDKQNSAPYSQVFELWYEQRLFNNKLRVKAGKVDANTEFSVIDSGLSFLNSSAQVTPTLFVLPTTPAPMPGVNLFYTPKGPFYGSFAVYDANSSDHFLDFCGRPESMQPTRRGKLLIGEAGLSWKRNALLGADGNLRLGLWKHTGSFTRFDGGVQGGAKGVYVILDQTLWKPSGAEDGQRGLRTFLEYGQTDRAVAPVYRHFGGGLAWTGLLPGRQQDVVGFSPQYARLSPGPGLAYNYELALEAFYRLQVTPWGSVQPDLQYVAHPGGQYPSALVGTLHLELSF